jgi:hypothetical protein
MMAICNLIDYLNGVTLNPARIPQPRLPDLSDDEGRRSAREGEILHGIPHASSTLDPPLWNAVLDTKRALKQDQSPLLCTRPPPLRPASEKIAVGIASRLGIRRPFTGPSFHDADLSTESTWQLRGTDMISKTVSLCSVIGAHRQNNHICDRRGRFVISGGKFRLLIVVEPFCSPKAASHIRERPSWRLPQSQLA